MSEVLDDVFTTSQAVFSGTIYMAAAVVGPRGLRDAWLLNQGDGSFLEAAAAFGLPLDQASLGVAAADFDADR